LRLANRRNNDLALRIDDASRWRRAFEPEITIVFQSRLADGNPCRDATQAPENGSSGISVGFRS
jgi:hypothetical protein